MIKLKKRVKKKHKSYILLIITLGISIFIGTLTYKVNEIRSTGILTEPINENVLFLLNDNYEKLTNNSIYQKQEEIINNIKKEYNKNLYTIDNPYIVLEPFDNTTNTALIMFKTENKESVEVILKGINNDDLIFKYDETTNHIISLYGLYSNYKNKIIIKTSSGLEKELFINIEGNNKNNKGENIKNEYVYIQTEDNISLFDSLGNIRLNYNYKATDFIEYNNNLILSIYDNSKSYLLELDKLGYIVKKIDFNEIINKIEKINEYLLINTNNKIIVYDYINNSIIKEIDLLGIFKNIDSNYNNNININQMMYDYDNNLLVILLDHKTIIAFDYDTYNIKYMLGNKRDWSYRFNKYFYKYYYNYNYLNYINNFILNNNLITISTLDKNNDNFCLGKTKAYNIIYEIDNNYRLKEKEKVNSTNNVILNTNNFKLNYDCSNYNITDENNNILFSLNNNSINKIDYYKNSNNNNNFNNYQYINNYPVAVGVNDKDINKLKKYQIKNYTYEYKDDILTIKSNDKIDYLVLLSRRGFAYRFQVINNEIYINGLNKGKYYLFMIENGVIYNSTKYIDML